MRSRERLLYFIETGESCRLDDHKERHFREHCRTAIEDMVKALDGTGESSVCQSLDDRYTVFGEVHHELRMDGQLLDALDFED